MNELNVGIYKISFIIRKFQLIVFAYKAEFTFVGLGVGRVSSY